jgi:ABC-type multidrug transport system ATPase subunit
LQTVISAGNPPVLAARGLGFGWHGAVPLWHGMDLDIPAGVSLLRGGEGSGKTTLLRLLCGDLMPSAGTLNIADLSLEAGSDAHRGQVFRTDPRSAALDAVCAHEWFGSLERRWPDFRPSAVPDLIEGFALGPHMHKPLYMLSAGSRRKVWLTGALAAGTVLTLLDEPFAALDRPSIRFLLDLMQDAARHTSRAWVLADHEPPEGIPLANVIDLDDRP